MKYKFNKCVQIILVNIITLSRLVGAFILPFIYTKYGSSISSLFTLVLFATDAIDGFLARALRCSTFFGSILDGLSDKMLNAVSFILLCIEYNIMIAPLILEIAILYTMYNTYVHRGNVQSSKTGKIKTVVLDICVIISFVIIGLPTLELNMPIINYLINHQRAYIMFLGSIITISSIFALVDYIKKNKEVKNNPKLKRIKLKGKVKKSLKELFNNLFNTDYYYQNKDESIMKLLYK